MQDNIFFDLHKLRHIGKNVIIGKTVRIRYPELVSIGDNCIIDDFTYISVELNLKGYNHIAAGCKIIGGKKSSVSFDIFSTLSPNVIIAAGSDDYLSGIATPFVPDYYKAEVKYSWLEIGKHVIIGSGSVILPNSNISDGTSVGALSLVNTNTDPWHLYAGIPAKKIKARNKSEILRLERDFFNEMNDESR